MRKGFSSLSKSPFMLFPTRNFMRVANGWSSVDSECGFHLLHKGVKMRFHKNRAKLKAMGTDGDNKFNLIS